MRGKEFQNDGKKPGTTERINKEMQKCVNKQTNIRSPASLLDKKIMPYRGLALRIHANPFQTRHAIMLPMNFNDKT